MRLATYQPFQRNHASDDKPWHRFRDFLGYEPVFCFPADTAEEFLFGCFYVAASYSECLYAFETDNYRMFDFIKWIGIMFNDDLSKDDIASLFSNVNPRYAEFIIPESALNNALNVVPISEMIQDAADSYSDPEHIFDVRNLLWRGMAEAEQCIKNSMEYMNTDSELIRTDLVRRSTENVLGYALYKLAFDEPFEYPFDFIPVYPPKEDRKGRKLYERDDKLLMDMYHGDVPFSRRNFDKACRMFEKLLKRHAIRVQRMTKQEENLLQGGGRRSRHSCSNIRPAQA